MEWKREKIQTQPNSIKISLLSLDIEMSNV